jgi:alanine racemase
MRATKATVRLGAIGQNLKTVMTLAPGCKVLPVIKANAYGHGAIAVARKLESFRSSQVPAFAVAFMDEAVRLRDAGIERPILVLQGCSEPGDVVEAAARDFCLMLHHPDQVERVRRSKTRQPVKVWLKVDTGMRRLGLNVADLDLAVSTLAASANVKPGTVLCSHLACADELDSPVTKQQIERLKSLVLNYQLAWSLANSAGIIGWPQSHGDWVRPGYMLYGNNPMKRDFLNEGHQEQLPKLIPAMTMTAEIIAIRKVMAGEGVGYGHDWVASEPTTVGVVSIGYADGYPRHARSGTPVWVNGQRAAVAGRVSMDMITIDLAGIKPVAVGDEVELWGQNLNVDEVAAHAGTIGYEILAGLSGRAPINYLS